MDQPPFTRMDRGGGLQPRNAQAVPDHAPTLSILLPCKNEAATLQRQLNAILGQLGPRDQIVCLDDGSTDGTWEMMARVSFPNTTVISNRNSVGVCLAYNRCAAEATGDWILGASGNDEVQPGTIALWRQAAMTWPEARLAFGNIADWRPLEWRTGVDYIAPAEWPSVWQRCGGLRTHGAAAFIRRDAWGEGYIPEIQWMADWYLTFIISLRHGAIHLPHVCSKVYFGGGSFSALHTNDIAYNEAMRAMIRAWERPCNDDIRFLGEAFHMMTGWRNLRDPRPPEVPRMKPTGRLPGRLVDPTTYVPPKKS